MEHFSEAKTGGFIFSILQPTSSNFFSSEIDLNSVDKVFCEPLILFVIKLSAS